MIDDHYAKNSQQLFLIEKRNTTFPQANTGKYECHKITVTYLFIITYYLPITTFYTYYNYLFIITCLTLDILRHSF